MFFAHADRTRRFFLLTTALLAALLAASVGAQSDPPPAKPAAAESAESALSARVVTIGASLTCGFGNSLPLAEPLDRAITGKHTPVFNAGEGLQFTDPIGLGEAQVDRCLERKATLVIGIDFLFWYAYGMAFKGKTEWPRRSERFAAGLRQLERLACPVVVGDLPDMRGAHPRMLHPAMIPSPEVLARLNQVLKDWADKREQVHLVPLSAWVKTLKAGEWKVPASADGKQAERILTAAVAMQWDRLHPSRLGILALTGRLVSFLRARLGAGADRFRFDVWREVKHFARPRSAPQSEPPVRAPREPASSPRQPSGSGR